MRQRKLVAWVNLNLFRFTKSDYIIKHFASSKNFLWGDYHKVFS